MEEFSESQEELALKLEEDKAQISEELRDLKYEIESERQSHEVEVNILTRKIENAENDVKKLESSLKQLKDEHLQYQQDFKAKLLSAEKKAEMEKSALQNEIEHFSSNQSALQSELLQLKQQNKSQKQYLVQKSSDAMAKQKARHDTVVEKLNSRLSAFEQREETLLDKLEEKAKQVQAQHEREATLKQQISAFEVSEIAHQTEVSQLKSNITKLESEISQMKSAAVVYKNKISSLKAELMKDTELDDFLSLQSSSRRSSSSPDSSRHSEIIRNMKMQLGELQKWVGSKSDEEGGQANELINKLVASSSALEAEMQRMRRGFSAERLSHKEMCSEKDQNLQSLQAERRKQSNLVRDLAIAVSQDMTSQMTSLESNCSKSMLGCGIKLDDALSKLASISQSLSERDSRHAGQIHSLLSALDQSHGEVSSSRGEIDRLQVELEKSNQNLDMLNKSQEYLERLHRDKDTEMDELKSKLEQLRRESSADRVTSDVLSSRHIKVDEDSGQVIAEHEEGQTRDEALLEKEEIIHALREELEQLKQAENHSKLVIEDVKINRRLFEKEEESEQIIQSLQRRISELESNLEDRTHAQEVRDACIILNYHY